MPYGAGRFLPSEKASKLGHLEVLKSPLVQQLVQSFVQPPQDEEQNGVMWIPFPPLEKPLDLIFSVDGSIQVIQDEMPPYKSIAFIKTALLRLDQVALDKIDKESPHPFALRDLMSDSALYHATALPLNHVKIQGHSVYNTIRRIIFESLKDASLNGEPMETLKWLAYEKWTGNQRDLPVFQCPHCGSDNTTLPYESETGNCPTCGQEIYISDMLGFHHDMADESARDIVATAYMNIHETLLLFTGIRHFWETSPQTLNRCLFIKDGPLQIPSQYSKLISPIIRFLFHAFSKGTPVYLLGQEKTGAFVDHLNLIGKNAPANHLFIPTHNYICEEIKHRSPNGTIYGQATNYGAKVFLTVGDRCRLILSIPLNVEMKKFMLNPEVDNIIGLSQILSSLPNLLSSRHENALMPIEMANNVASLSTYPSAQVLKLFADSAMSDAS